MTLAKLLASNTTNTSTSASFALATSQPADNVSAGVGVHVMQEGTKVRLIFFGAGADNATFSARLLRVVDTVTSGGGVTSSTDWIYEQIGVFTGALSTAVGAAGRIVTDTERFADTIAFTAGSGDPTTAFEISSNADNKPAELRVDLKGATYLVVVLTVSTATSMNALIQEIA
jgi:hypothetical protein